MAFNGVRLFRYALLGEIMCNAGGAVLCLFYPSTALSYFVKGPVFITPVTQSLIQWLGALVITSFTLPLALCYPNPRPSQGGDVQIVAWRRVTYMGLGAGELGLSTIILVQYLQGDSGFTDTALLSAATTLGLFGGMRAFFLYVRPSWMEAQENARKAQ